MTMTKAHDQHIILKIDVKHLRKRTVSINLFQINYSFLYPMRTQKKKRFLMFSKGMETEHRLEIG